MFHYKEKYITKRKLKRNFLGSTKIGKHNLVTKIIRFMNG